MATTYTGAGGLPPDDNTFDGRNISGEIQALKQRVAELERNTGWLIEQRNYDSHKNIVKMRGLPGECLDCGAIGAALLTRKCSKD